MFAKLRLVTPTATPVVQWSFGCYITNLPPIPFCLFVRFLFHSTKSLLKNFKLMERITDFLPDYLWIDIKHNLCHFKGTLWYTYHADGKWFKHLTLALSVLWERNQSFKCLHDCRQKCLSRGLSSFAFVYLKVYFFLPRMYIIFLTNLVKANLPLLSQ